MKKITSSLYLITLFSQFSFSQILGGRDNGEMTPRSVEASKLNPGGVISDVNTFTGEYTSTIPIGSIGTPGGLNFSLSINYASNTTLGTTAAQSSGIPYGEGWSLGVPILSIESDIFHKYLLIQEDYQHQPCGAGQSGFVMNYDGPVVAADPVDKYTGLDHGDAYWFAPSLSIPGVISGRLVFKYLDGSNNQLVFALQGFESPVEIRMINTKTNNITTTKWTVTLADGTQYLFDFVNQAFNSPINTRVLDYDMCLSDGGTSAAAVSNGTYTFNSNQLENRVLNSILPKYSSAIWYCTKITNNFIENQQIELTYDKYGKFNFYNEFSPENDAGTTMNNKLNDNLKEDYSTYRDVILKKVVSKVESYPFEIMELDYQLLMDAITTNYNILINPNAANSGAHDNMYSWTKVYQQGGSSGNSFSGWYRYQHIKAASTLSEMSVYQTYNMSLTNPYISTNAPGSNSYRRTTGVGNPNSLAFQDGFLETERIQAAKMIPGDIYEVRTRISDTRGTVDIAVVSGDLGTTPVSGTGNFSTYNSQSGNWYSASNYDKSRGIELFSTFNSALKWFKPLANNYTNELKTSNFFVMPNVPSSFQGFHIQVGPGNSDITYDTPPETLFQPTPNQTYPQKSWRSKEAYSFMGSAYTILPNIYDKLYKSGAIIPHNFGIGMPWGMMVPMYQSLESPTPFTDLKSMFQTWYMDQSVYNDNSNSFDQRHRPTTMGFQQINSYSTELEELQVIRYSKSPYMLRGVRIYRVNNGNETTGKQLIAQKQIDYTYDIKPLVQNFDYYNYDANTPTQTDPSRSRITFFLNKVHDLPINAVLYASSFGLTPTEANQVLTTTFEYTNQNINVNSDLTYVLKGEKIYALNKITNHLGGVTNIFYKALTQSDFRGNYSPQFSSLSQGKGYSSYGKGFLTTGSIRVEKVEKISENTTPQTWTYSFSNQVSNHSQYLLNTNHFRNEFSQSISRGYKNAVINLPPVNGVASKTEIEHYGSTTSNLLDYLCFGKVKTTKQFMDNILNNETTNTYSYTLAFENGAIRPAFKQNHSVYNADMTTPYHYEDYYLNQTNFNSLTEAAGQTELQTYYSTYNPTLLKREQPKMMEAWLYADLLVANQSKEWLFNSYFVKLESTSVKQYENGEYKTPSSNSGTCYDRDGNIIPCPIVVIKPTDCNQTLDLNRRAIETVTTYAYYEADQKGNTQGTAYHNLLSINPTNAPVINFSNYGMGSDTRSQAVIKLKHEPSWQLASVTVSSPQLGTASKKEEYFYFYDLINRYDRHWYLYDLVNNSNFNVQLINGDTIAVNNILTNVMRDNNYSLPRYEGLESSRTHNLRSLAFQKTTHGKNTSDVALSKSEYYHFDNSWTYNTTPPMKPVLLRYAAIQIDTMSIVSGNSEFRTGRIDRTNKYIADFKAVSSTIQPDGKNYIYSLIAPYDILIVKKITERNRLMMPITMEDQMGVKTRYNINVTNTSGIFNNLGLIESIVIGYSRTDAMTSSFQYNLQGKIKKLTEPTGRYLDYLYDNYLRLKQTTENGTRLLSTINYSIWDRNTYPGYNFGQRTGMNVVLTDVYNSATTNDKEMLRSFIDPLGREHSTLQAYFDLTNTIQRNYSPTLVYDNWNRIVKTYKPYQISSGSLEKTENTSTPFAETNYEKQITGRPVESADYGENITSSTHIVKNEYQIVNGVVAYCELGLNNVSGQIMMTSTGYGGLFFFYRQTTTDQDGKQSINYTNAFGQKAAVATYTTTGQKAVTVFGYDSYGNLNKVYNPNGQITTYLYNIMGKLIMETSPDAGTKRFMYNKLGLVSVAQDHYDRTRTVNGSSAARFRVYKYDDYGKLTGVGLMNAPSPGVSDPLYYSTIYSPNFGYIFSNASTYDWLCSYLTTNKFGDQVSVNVTPATFNISQWEKSFVYGVTQGQNTLGKLVQDNSFNNSGVKILKNNYTYDAVGNIGSQLTTFSPVNADGTVNITTSKIDYPSYNYRRSLLEQTIDVNNDNVTDLHLFFKYDPLNRLSSISAAMGAVASSADATLLTSYTYDVEGKITKKEQRIDDSTPINRLAMEIAYSYDIRNRLTEIDSKNGTISIAKYSLFYDAQTPVSGSNTVTSHQNWNGNLNGSLMEYNFGTATNSVYNFNETTLYGYQYDLMNRLTKADAAIGDFITENAIQGALIGDEEITYDKIGNIGSIKRSLKGSGANFTETEWWTYNYQSGTNKLISVTGQNAYSANRNYTYDSNGNLLTDSYRAINQPIQYGRAAYAYQLIKGINADVIDYLYDTKDQRIYKKLDATDNNQDNETFYLQDIFGKTVAIKETKVSGTNWVYYISSNEREMTLKPTAAQAPGSNASNTNKRVGMQQVIGYLYDHLGNTRVSYSAQSWDNVNNKVLFKIESATDYTPYGKIIHEFVNELPRYLTTQHERDAETGLDYRGARYYDSDIGRFLSTDPWADQYPSYSTYNYVLGKPIMYIDPTGKGAEDWVKKPTGDIVWDPNATSPETTQPGDKYVGKSGKGTDDEGNMVTYNSDGTKSVQNESQTVVYGKRQNTAPTSKTQWMETALQEFKTGVKEEPLGSNSGPRVNEYLKSAGASSPNPWCASFVHWCLAQNGIKGAGAAGKSYLKWGVKLDVPKYGAVAVFKTGHVGFYMDSNKDGTLKILHGNWSNKVKISSGVYDPIYPKDIQEYRFPILK